VATVIEQPVSTETTPVVAVKRRTIDAVVSALGMVTAVVLLVAGMLLTWGSNFANDYVYDELSSQQIFFNDADALIAEGREDLARFGGMQVTTGEHAEAYASYIGGHLEETADGLTYSQLGGPQRAARTAVAEARESGASEDEIATLQAELDTINGQRDSLFRGETLRGLLLSTYAWDTIGKIAGFAAIAAFVGAGLLFILSIMGFVHYAKTPKTA
jgi:hypothetical protein